MAGRSNNTTSWEELDRFGPASTPVRQSDPAANPFRAKPVERKAFRPMTVEDRVRLEQAPKRTSGPATKVTMLSYDIAGLPGRAEHAYVEFDDGRERLIARGGPDAGGAALVGSAAAGQLSVQGGVTPAYLSRDEGKGTRVLFRGELPGLSAREASEGAVRIGRDLERDPRRYTLWSNSNSYAGDVVEDLFRVRPGDRLTPGSAYPLSGARRPGAAPDLSPALRNGGW